MDANTPDNTLNSPENNAQSQANTRDHSKSDGKWIRWPDELPSWLSKRIEFSLPVWACALTTVVLAFLVFD